MLHLKPARLQRQLTLAQQENLQYDMAWHNSTAPMTDTVLCNQSNSPCGYGRHPVLLEYWEEVDYSSARQLC